ncbi:type IV toxin-antitoxin system AbiEi family antitoxin domain-containing protein [Guggenheimella bovis]
MKLKDNDGLITTKEALSLGIHKDVLKESLAKYEVVKIATGLYALPGEEIDEYIYFSHRVPKGVFSHETAAYLHGLTTRMPLLYVMSVITGTNVTRVKTERDDVLFKYVKSDTFDIGKTTIKNPFGRFVAVYDKERTILDLIKDKERLDTYSFSEALKEYFSSREKDLLKLSQYAIQMNMEEKLRTYTEVLL